MESADNALPPLNESGRQQNQKYLFNKALRPFSFSVALVTCSMGIVMAYRTINVEALSALLIIIGGLLLQAGVNLINDHADLKNQQIAKALSPLDKAHIIFNYRVGWLCFACCSLIGLYLTYHTTLFLLLIAIIGGAGALFYTAEPVNYKNRGLGVLLVFFFMGVLMIYGAFYAATGQHSLNVIVNSIPVSFLTSALLLSNELRDFHSDQRENIKTLTVRIGFHAGGILYNTIIVLAFLAYLLLVISTISFLHLIILTPAAMIAFNAIRIVNAQLAATDTTSACGSRTTSGNEPALFKLPPITGMLYLVFGIGQISLLLLTP